MTSNTKLHARCHDIFHNRLQASRFCELTDVHFSLHRTEPEDNSRVVRYLLEATGLLRLKIGLDVNMLTDQSREDASAIVGRQFLAAFQHRNFGWSRLSELSNTDLRLPCETLTHFVGLHRKTLRIL